METGVERAQEPDRFASAIDVATRLLNNIETVVYGKREEVKLVVAALMCGGHVLLEDVPGTAKTVLARAIGGSIDGVTISLRLTSDAPCPDCNGTGGKPGTKPHICPECEGAGFIVNNMGGAFSVNETCPKCGGRQLIYDEPCPTCHGSGRGTSARTIQASFSSRAASPRLRMVGGSSRRARASAALKRA